MENKQRIEKIKTLFVKIKEAREWCVKNYNVMVGLPDKPSEESVKFWHDRIAPALGGVYSELEGLGVSRLFSMSLLHFGAEFTKSLWEQFTGEVEYQVEQPKQ